MEIRFNCGRRRRLRWKGSSQFKRIYNNIIISIVCKLIVGTISTTIRQSLSYLFKYKKMSLSKHLDSLIICSLSCVFVPLTVSYRMGRIYCPSVFISLYRQTSPAEKRSSQGERERERRANILHFGNSSSTNASLNIHTEIEWCSVWVQSAVFVPIPRVPQEKNFDLEQNK